MSHEEQGIAPFRNLSAFSNRPLQFGDHGMTYIPSTRESPRSFISCLASCPAQPLGGEAACTATDPQPCQVYPTASTAEATQTPFCTLEVLSPQVYIRYSCRKSHCLEHGLPEHRKWIDSSPAAWTSYPRQSPSYTSSSTCCGRWQPVSWPGVQLSWSATRQR